MKIVNNDPTIACPNANWNGTTTNYCNGVTSDDVVAHEWGHAYTEYTHGLIYQYQSGALNESYSDIWGETVDLINGRMDEDEGDITTKRPDGLCSTHTPRPAAAHDQHPASIAKNCSARRRGLRSPGSTNTGVTGTSWSGIDDVTTPPAPVHHATRCSAFTNGAAVDRQDRPGRPRHLRLRGQGQERPERRRSRPSSWATRPSPFTAWPAPTAPSPSRRCSSR